MVVGARNLSVAYYGIDRRGQPDPFTYIDMEIVVRPPPGAAKYELHVGQIAWYFQRIFRHFGNKRLISSARAREQIDNPQIYMYQTGRLDSHLLVASGTVYGKLHAKFLAGPRAGFVGTSNFDYRSRLLNSEIGFFTVGEHPSEELNAEFEKLIKISYRWGTPEWLEMRRRLMQAGGSKSTMTRMQRTIYKLIKSLHLEWMI